MSLSPTGRFVVFGSDATNLVAGDINQQRDVFVRDLQRGVTELLSVRPNGSEVPLLGGNSSASYGPGSAISSDGRYVVFSSNSTLLVPNDTNGQKTDWFVRDRALRRTERVSVDAAGTDRNIGSGGAASITPDGRDVVFETAENLVPDDNGSCGQAMPGVIDTDVDTYLNDLSTGAIELISRSTSGRHAAASAGATIAGCQQSNPGGISDDGTRVAFVSDASNLTTGDTNNAWDVFVRTRGQDVGVGALGEAAAPPSGADAGQHSLCAESLCLPRCLHETCPPSILDSRVVVRPIDGDIGLVMKLRSWPVDVSAYVFEWRFRTSDVQYELRGDLKPGSFGSGRFLLFRGRGDRSVQIATLFGSFGATGLAVTAAIPVSYLGGPVNDLSEVSASIATGWGHVPVSQSVALRGTLA
jgi:hypothetical protein